jgi:maltoporin
MSAESVKHEFASTEHEIMRLINEANEARDKAYLMLMFKMHQSLTKNTEATVATAEKVGEYTEAFDKHVGDEEKIFSQFRGGWRVIVSGMSLITVLFSVIQFLGYQVIQAHIQSNQEDSARVTVLVQRTYDLEKEVSVLKALLKREHPELESKLSR